MKTRIMIKNLRLALFSVFLMIVSVSGYSQTCTGNIETVSLANFTQTSTTLEYDIMLSNTGTTTMLLNAASINVLFSSNVLPAGATGSVQLVTGPGALDFANHTNGTASYASATRGIRYAGIPNASTTTSLTTTPKRYARVRLTSTLPWNSNTVATFTINPTNGTPAGAFGSSSTVYCNGNAATATLTPVLGTLALGGPFNYTLSPLDTCFTSGTASGIVGTSCFGQTTGSATITMSPAPTSNAITYTVDGGASTPGTLVNNAFSVSGLAAGQHTVVVTGSGTCTTPRTVTFTVGGPTTNLVASSNAGTIACFGGTTNIVVSATGGTAPYTGTGTFSVSAGAYSYTVSDANGCTSTTSGSVSQPTQLNASASAGTIACNGGTTTVEVSATGGTAPYSGTGTFTVSAGAYSYTVTDANGCTSTTSGTITQPSVVPTPTITAGGPISFCSGGSVTLTSSAGNSYLWSTGATTASITVSASGSYTVQVTNGSGCQSAASEATVVTLTAQPQWYLDADNDGYYTGSAISSCTSPGSGYTTIITAGGDCNDSSAAVNPGATEICYNNIDDNCNGQLSESCPTVVVNMTSTTATLTLFSNAVSALPYSLSPYTNLKYRFIITKIQAGQPNEVQEVTLPTRFVTIPQAMRSYTATYTIRAAAVINDEILAYLGNTMTVTPPPVALITLSSFSCGATLGSLNATISAVSGLNATGYIFRIRKATGTSAVTGPFFTSSSVTRFIGANTFTGLPLEYNGAYKVSVAYTYLDPSDNSTKTTAYGAECDLFTLSIPTINLVAPTCGTVQSPAAVSSMTATVSAAGAVGATGYQFRIRQTGGATYFTTAILPSRFTQLSLFGTILSFSTNYSISVQFYSPIDGVSTPSGYGSECHITTPVFPTTQLVQTQCGNSYTLTQQLNIVPYPGFPRYRVKLTQPDPGNPEEVFLITSRDLDYSYFKMSDFPEVQVGQTYFIEVAIQINGVFGDYGNSCEISVVAPSIAKAVLVPFKATAYPNPFADNFMLDVKTTSQSIVNVKVYDMVGRIIEQRELRTSDLETTSIGNNYPSGVYNVVVAQEDNVQTVRVVKR